MARFHQSTGYVPLFILATISGINLTLHLGLLAAQSFLIGHMETVPDFLIAAGITGFGTGLLGFVLHAGKAHMGRRQARSTYRIGLFISLLLAALSCALILVIDPASLQVAFLAIVTGGFVAFGILIKLSNYRHAF